MSHSLKCYIHPLGLEDRAIVRPDFDCALPCIGTIRPRSTEDTGRSNWFLGCETLDRGYTDYDEYKDYLKPLGIHTVRLQSGWAKTEKQAGVYDWAWLDHIIDDLCDKGLHPWLQIGYGNPVYAGAGGWNLGAGMPRSKEGMDAYLKYAEALVLRYRDRVADWEIWNEPNFGDNRENTPEITAEFNILTGRIIKRHQPDSRVSCLTMGHIDLVFTERFFSYLSGREACGLFDNVTYHDYVYNPDANRLAVYQFRQIVQKYAPGMKLRQGENGAPSVQFAGGALGEYPWTELSQAKWDARRMLDNLGNDIESSIFSIAEMQYDSSGPIKKANAKGLLQTSPDKKVLRPKVAYYAVQHIASVFDDTLSRLPGVRRRFTLDEGCGDCCHVNTDRSLAIYGYQKKDADQRIYTIWRDDAIPADQSPVTTLDFLFAGSHFQEPVLADIVSGLVYELPSGCFRRRMGMDEFRGVPVWDAPILIAEKTLLPIGD